MRAGTSSGVVGRAATVGVLASLVAGIAAWAPPTAVAATQASGPGADATVKGGSSTSNFGSATTLWLRSDVGTANDGEAYLRFDYSSLGAPIASARLLLTPTSISLANKLTVRARLVADGGDGWSETALTYATRPSDLTAATAIAGGALTYNVTIALDVTALLTQAGNANGIATFHLDLSSPNGKPQISLASREAATVGARPALELVTADANRPPAAVADTATVAADATTAISVLANDSDPDGDPLTLLAVSTPAHGTATIVSGRIAYTPVAGYTGPDAFSYTTGDGHGGLASAGVAVTVAAAVTSGDTWPHRYFAPYVDATAWPTFDLAGVARTTGIRYYQLGFVVADGSNRPSWGGYYTMDQGFLLGAIGTLRGLGGDVAASFGGAAGAELATRITDLTALTSAYQSVITTYSLTHVDFDIEGTSLSDTASVDRRNAAIARLQANARAAGRPLVVAFTLPVLPTGLTSGGRALIASALARGVAIDAVNVMAMDYGDGAAPNPSGQMGTYATQAATSTKDQLKTVYANAGRTLTDAEAWRLVGITPMIGVNDVTSEVFTPADAQVVVDFARSVDLRELAFWDENRDQPAPAGSGGVVSGSHCGITTTTPYQFAGIFLGL